MNRSRRRLTIFAVVGIVAIAAACFYPAFWLYHPIGSGPAGPDVPMSSFSKAWSDQPVVLLGFGDSITAGLGSTKGHSYFERLIQNPPDEFADMQGRNLSAVMPQLTTVNVAVSGTDSVQHRDWLLDNVEPQDPDVFGVIVATIGGNDVIHMYGRTPPREGAMYGATIEQARPWIANFEIRLNTILDELSDRFPGGCHIFLANIYDPTDGVGDAHNAGLPRWPEGSKVLAAYNDVLSRTAEQREDVTLIDIRSAFLGHGIHCRKFWHPHYDSADPHYWYFDNLEDPNDRGYDAIRRLYLLKIVDVLPDLLRDRASSEIEVPPAQTP